MFVLLGPRETGERSGRHPGAPLVGARKRGRQAGAKSDSIF